jgi:hypothetical protein
MEPQLRIWGRRPESDIQRLTGHNGNGRDKSQGGCRGGSDEEEAARAIGPDEGR